MHKEIKDYIIEVFGSDTIPEYRTKHYSYCRFPEEDCTCGDISEIDYNTSLIRGGYLDSFNMVVVLKFIEVKYDVIIPDPEATAENFDTVNKIVELINKHK